jgi:hypothetical protein
VSGICLPIDADVATGLPEFAAGDHRGAQAALLLGRTDRPLGAVSGVRPGSEPTVSATGTAWTVTPFNANADPGTALTVGPYLVMFAADETGAIDPADSNFVRVDRLDVQVPDDPPGGDPREAVIVYTAGQAGSNPAAPAAPARSFPLATITVPKAGTGSPSVSTAIMARSVASGGILPCANSSAYPAHPFVGQHVYDLALLAVRVWDGDEWRKPDRPNYYRHCTFSQSNVPDATTTKVTSLTTVKEERDSATSPWASGTFTAPEDDAYTFYLWTSGIQGAARTTGRVMVQGSEVGGEDTTNGGAGRVSVVAANIWMTAGQTAYFDLFQNSGGAKTMTGVITVKQGF